jgi:hypothetical protein
MKGYDCRSYGIDMAAHELMYYLREMLAPPTEEDSPTYLLAFSNVIISLRVTVGAVGELRLRHLPMKIQ